MDLCQAEINAFSTNVFDCAASGEFDKQMVKAQQYIYIYKYNSGAF